MNHHLFRSELDRGLKIFALLFVLCMTTSGQETPKASGTFTRNNDWLVFSPPSRRFTLELPSKPSERTENSGTVGFTIFKGTKALSTFTLPSLAAGRKNRFVIWEIELAPCERKGVDFDDELLGLILLVAGDEHKLLLNENGMMDGNPTRSVIYENGTELAGRIFAVNAKNYIYLLSYARTSGSLAEEDRIFRSFRLSHILEK